MKQLNSDKNDHIKSKNLKKPIKVKKYPDILSNLEKFADVKRHLGKKIKNTKKLPVYINPTILKASGLIFLLENNFNTLSNLYIIGK